ncbi:AraC family transcriptional regulator [Paenibacillus silvisoli]|uniref:AraC family transcriptional regulator n=1 Tax=Paenibacillus silvisoli TaxID=3110539 RepID=UPI002804E091|nr:helix-turn-helix domain-containing protein [Paenibacillus silvisoli]
MAVNARTLVKQIYNDMQVSKLLYFNSDDPADTSEALAHVGAYRATSPFIDSIYIYNFRTDTFFTSADVAANSVWSREEFYDTSAAEMVRHISEYKPLMPIPRKITFSKLQSNYLESERDCYSFVLYDTLSHNPNRNAIIVNISETQLHKNIDGMIINSEKNTFIIDSRGVLITNSWKDKMLTVLSERPYIRKILEQVDQEGYFVADVDGTKSLVTYTAPDFLDWRYIRIVPYGAITGDINKMRLVTIVVALAILAFGLFLSYLLSRKLSFKMRSKLSKLAALEAERRNHFTVVRQDLVRNLLLGSGSGNLSGLHADFKACDIRLNAYGRFSVCILSIDQYKAFKENYTHSDRKLLKFGMLNIVEEMLSPICPSFVVEMGDDRISVLVNVDESVEDIKRLLPDDLWRRIQACIQQYLRLSVSIAVGSIGDDAWSVSRLNMQAGEALFYRLFHGYDCLVYADDVEKLNALTYEYPLSKEKQLIDELMLGRTSEIKKLFREIAGEAGGYSYMSFHLAISRLAFAVNNAISTIRKNNDIPLDLNLNALLSCLYEAETLDDICIVFYEVFEGVAEGLKEKKSEKQNEVAAKIISIVQLKYMDQNLSLESISDEMNLSAAYIGRLFKKHTLNTILNYIIEVRMDKARELLTTTDLPIGDIAEKTGFSNSPYFYKAFKKMNGVTPADYRKHGQNSRESAGKVI